MAYADDIVLATEHKEDVEKMLEHVKTYEQAPNAKLNEKKAKSSPLEKKNWNKLETSENVEKEKK